MTTLAALMTAGKARRHAEVCQFLLLSALKIEDFLKDKLSSASLFYSLAEAGAD